MTPPKFSRPARAPGRITVQSTSNNTMVNLTTDGGQTLAWTSAGVLGYRHSRKSTTTGAQAAAEYIASRAHTLGVHRVHVRMLGLGYGKDTAVRALAQSGLSILSIRDITPSAHNGCRPPRRRRT